ncbi:T9SS type A sorting domain-containing protein, partial [Seonamhaeicola marinus]|uniref:T9SS type A sorting domain-containing protein n=1 Tax=Seonamhaeicola marinus TaxID=1912246 RepID=UPI001652870E
ITQPTVLSASISSQTNVSCNGLSDGSATVGVSGGVAPYTYDWDNGETTQSISDLHPGTYDITVTDANGCEAFASVIITEPLVVGVPTVTTPITYNQGDTASQLTATLGANATGLIWYTIDTIKGGVGDTTAPTPSTNEVGNTSYWVSSVNANGCESEAIEIEVIVSSTLSETSNQVLKTVSFYPNPASSTIFIKNIKLLELDLEVLDLNGRLLLKQRIDSVIGEVNISKLNTGIYLFKLKTQNGEFTKRIIKN